MLPVCRSSEVKTKRKQDCLLCSEDRLLHLLTGAEPRSHVSVRDAVSLNVVGHSVESSARAFRPAMLNILPSAEVPRKVIAS